MSVLCEFLAQQTFYAILYCFPQKMQQKRAVIYAAFPTS